MEENSTNISIPHRWITFLAGGVLGVLYFSLCISIFIISFSREILTSSGNNESVTPTVTLGLTPEILFEVLEDKSKTQFDDFTSNFRQWELHYRSNGKIQIINQKMVVQSDRLGNMVIVTNEDFIPQSNIYYAQAEFATDIETSSQSYGLVFGLNRAIDSFYFFEITPQNTVFRLFKYTTGNWERLIDYTDAEMNQYPKENILGVYFKEGNIELHINGILATTYIDQQPLQFSGVGVFASNAGYRLIVDNFFAHTE